MVRGEGHGLRVMEPSEAVDYTATRFHAHLQGARSVHERCSAVASVSVLDSETRDRYERQADARIRVLQSIQASLAASTAAKAALESGE